MASIVDDSRSKEAGDIRYSTSHFTNEIGNLTYNSQISVPYFYNVPQKVKVLLSYN